MLRSNSKKACENIRNYIIEHFWAADYTDTPPQEFPEIAAFILDIFRKEIPDVGNFARMSEQQRFEYWESGLTDVLYCGYYYDQSAVDDLGEILEETDEEKEKYSEDQARVRLTWLIYRELLKGEKRAKKNSLVNS